MAEKECINIQKAPENTKFYTIMNDEKIIHDKMDVFRLVNSAKLLFCRVEKNFG
jgi:hypothetical protein